jgi:ABC-type Fe3+ transport system substrate-binding protein
MGTPSYVAPEIVMGTVEDGRSDQYSLGLTVHETLTGRNEMSGPSPSATLVNQTRISPTPLIEVQPQLPLRLSDAVDRALSKDPERRFPNCVALAREILSEVPTGELAAAGSTLSSGLFKTGSSPTPSLARTVEARMVPAKAGVNRRLLLGAGIAGGVVAIGGVATWLLGSGALRRADDQSDRVDDEVHGGSSTALRHQVAITIAYGSEKKKWLIPAAEEFRKTPLGRSITITLRDKGSVEGARAVLDGPGNEPIHVWSPASSAYTDVFVRDWTEQHGNSPILEARDLALTPMVFVLWKSRYDAFLEKYEKVSFQTIAKAMAEPRGWAAIANRPEWGSSFKFSHTDPHQSNSGLLALVLMAYDFFAKQRDLQVADIASPEFRDWLASFERNVARTGSGLIHSTGTLMEEMVKRGSSEFDAVLVYENLAIDFMSAARERWGDEGALQVAYPDPNVWNGHPYYILDVPWSSPDQRSAAKLFLDFLLSDPIQSSALKHGFRPGNASLGVNSPDSPLVQAEPIGVRIKIPPTCEAPRAEVVTMLLDHASPGST